MIFNKKEIFSIRKIYQKRDREKIKFGSIIKFRKGQISNYNFKNRPISFETKKDDKMF